MVIVEVRERRRQRLGVGARQAGAPEHQRDIVVEHIGCNAAPEQLHHRTGAIPCIDAGPSQFENFAGISDEPGDVIFGRRVERAEPGRRLAPDQPIGADDAIGTASPAVVEYQEVIADAVVAIEVAPQRLHPGERPRSHDLVKDAIAQRLRRLDIGGVFGEPNLQRSRDDIDDPPPPRDETPGAKSL